MRISDWSSDVCSSDLQQNELWSKFANQTGDLRKETGTLTGKSEAASRDADVLAGEAARDDINVGNSIGSRSEEHTSELQSLMRISYAVFCSKNKQLPITYNESSTNS